MNDPSQSMALFALSASAKFGAAVGAELGIVMGRQEETAYGGREYKSHALGDVRGRSVYVVQSLFGDTAGSANDRLCQLLFFIASLKDAGAARVTACIPYLAYARQDRRTEACGPTTTRYVAQMFESLGADRVLALDVHDRTAFDNAYRCETVHLEAATLFTRHFVNRFTHLGILPSREIVVLSPDIGGAKRAERLRSDLQASLGRPVGFAFMEKWRAHDGVSGTGFAGNVSGRCVILIDDLISSGTTVCRGIAAARGGGAIRVDVAVTHASFDPGALGKLTTAAPDSIVVTDSVSGMDGERAAPSGAGSPTVLSVAPLFAEAIRRLEAGSTVWELEAPVEPP